MAKIFLTAFRIYYGKPFVLFDAAKLERVFYLDGAQLILSVLS